MKKTIITIVVCVVVAVFVLSFAKDLIVKVAVEKGVQAATGLRLSMRGLSIGLIKTLVDIDGLELFNPKGYEDKIMIDMPEIYVNYDLPAIMKGKIHLKEVRIDLKEFVVVKNEKGELNLDSLKVVQEQKEAKKPVAKKEEKGKAPEIQIDSLQLKIGKVLYKDYSKGGKPSVQEFNINLDEKYGNIKDPNKLVSLILVKALMNTTISRLTGFDLKGLESTVSDTLGTAQKVVGETAAAAQKTITETTQKTQEVVKGTTETLKKGAEELKEAIKFPFGSKK